MMAGLGFAEILILALLSGGSGSTDLVAFIQPSHYFQTRGIEISVSRAVELANTEPKDAKSQVMQLTALRYLFDETEALKKSPNYDANRGAIEQIAQGKSAQDSLGFAKEYAERVLLKVDGRRLEPIKLPPMRDDAFNWFPANAQVLFAFDFRQAQLVAPIQDPLKEILKLVPDETKKQIYANIERAGNVRMERVAFAMTENAAKRNDNKIYVRFTGKANAGWAAEAAKALNPTFEFKTTKDAQDITMTTIQEPNRAPLMAMFGNTELLLVGYLSEMGKHQELLDEVLAIRAKKQPNATTGAFKERLAKFPDKSAALLLVDLSKDTKDSLRLLLDAAPYRIAGHIERVPQGLDFQVEASMANKDDADKFVQKISASRKLGIAALQQAMQQPPPQGVPPIPYQTLINLMESLQVHDKADNVQARVVVPDGLLQQLGSMGMIFGGIGAPPPPIRK